MLPWPTLTAAGLLPCKPFGTTEQAAHPLMGALMKILNTGTVVDGFARDGREFGHVTENLRDALLNGAQNVEFRIQGLALDRECVARRVIADDGTGMTQAVLGNVYSNLSITATDTDFDVTLNPDGTVTVGTEPVIITDSEHQRRGFGGRASNIGWNPFGVATITIHQGVARMVWMYRGFGGNPEMREWDEDGVKRSIIRPYTEPLLLTYEDLMVDKSFSKMLLVTGGIAVDEANAIALLDQMGYGDVIDNPLAGTEWDGPDVLPRWIVDHYDDHGLARRAGGALAHGTVKVLLGRSPYDSTAMTGDPAFIGEAEYSKYNGAANPFWLTLEPWNINIWVLTADPNRQDVLRREGYKLRGYPNEVRLDSGRIDATEPSGRRQWGALGLREKPSPELPDPIAYRAVLDLGQYGKALLLLRNRTNIGGKEIGFSNFYGSSREGVVAVVYGNELHGMIKDDLTTPTGVFTNMGIPMNDKTQVEPKTGSKVSLVSLFLFLPRQTATTPGVFQASARDRLKWSGRSAGLPMSGNGGINQAIAEALPEDFRRLIAPSDDEKITLSGEFLKRVRNLYKAAGDNATAGAAAVVAATRTALIAAGSVDAIHPGTAVGDQGKPGNNERPACEECGRKIHAPDCSRKRETSGGGCGGTRPVFKKLDEEDAGVLTGRKSRAKVTPNADGPVPELIPPEAPAIRFVKGPPGDNAGMPIHYDRPGRPFPDTGTILINEDHVAVSQLVGLAAKCGRDMDGTIRATHTWIKQQLVAVTLGVFALHDKPLTKGASEPTVQTPVDLIDNILVKDETWFMALSAMYFNDASLRSYITQHVAQRAPARKAA